MATVYNNIDRVAGDPQATAVVKVELLWDKTTYPVPKHVTEDYMIQGYFIIDVDEEGYWQASLVPNINIFPADSIYKVTDTIKEVDTPTTTYTYYIEVPDAASPHFWAGNLIKLDIPDWM
jgi:hypothetical protein